MIGVAAALGLLWLLNNFDVPQMARAASLTVCPSGPPACGYSTIQAAVDAAGDGDVIKIAGGIYTDVSVRPRQDYY